MWFNYYKKFRTAGRDGKFLSLEGLVCRIATRLRVGERISKFFHIHFSPGFKKLRTHEVVKKLESLTSHSWFGWLYWNIFPLFAGNDSFHCYIRIYFISYWYAVCMDTFENTAGIENQFVNRISLTSQSRCSLCIYWKINCPTRFAFQQVVFTFNLPKMKTAYEIWKNRDPRKVFTLFATPTSVINRWL